MARREPRGTSPGLFVQLFPVHCFSLATLSRAECFGSAVGQLRPLMLRERLDRDASEWESRSERVFGTFWNTRTDAAYHTRLLECRGAGELVGKTERLRSDHLIICQ